MTPAKLRSLKFEIGNLAQAVEVHHNHISDDFRQTHNLQPTVLAPPLDTSTDKSGIEKNKTGKKTHARTFTCKIGPTVVATCKLIFVDKKSERSALIQSGYPLNNQIISASHVELVDLYVGDSATLVDYLLPLMQHVVRVTIQADAQVIVLLASPKVVEVLEKIGFRVLKDDERSTRSRQKGGIWQILALPVKKIVGNASHSLPLKVWDRIYKQLYDYLKKNPKFTKL